MSAICKLWKHDLPPAPKVSGWAPFVPWRTCRRCGLEKPFCFDDTWGAVRPVVRVWHWVKRRAWSLRCAYYRLKTWNEPPPF